MAISQKFHDLIQQTRISGGGDVTALQVDFGNKLIAPAEQYLSSPTFSMNFESIGFIIIWLCGIILVFYVPLMPCIMYTTAVLGWFILVVQSFFVMQILGLSLIMPSNEMMGRVAKKLSLPLQILILPFLNVVTFILVIRLYKIGVELINLIMLNTVTKNFLGVSGLAVAMEIVVYVFLTLITMNVCFSLFYKISSVITTAIQDALSYQEANVQSQQTTALNTMITQKLVEKQTSMAGISTPVAGGGGGPNSSDFVKDPSGMSSGFTNSPGSPPLVPPVR
jgi:hypothetical protein